MARRSSSSRPTSPRSARSGGGRTGGRKRAVSAVEVHCPNCGAEYRVAETMLEKRVQCRRCGRVFVPQNLLRKGRRRSAGTGVPWAGAVTILIGLVLIVGGALVVSNMVSEKKAPPPRQAESARNQQADQADQAREEATVRLTETVVRWLNALKSGDQVALDLLTDPAGFYRSYPDGKKPKGRNGKPLSWSAMDPIDRVTWKNRIFQDLTRGDLGKPLREKEYLDGTFSLDKGDVLTSLYLEGSASFKAKGGDPRAVWIYSFSLTREGTPDKPRWRISGFSLKKKPKQKAKKRARPRFHLPKGVKPEAIQEVTIHREGKKEKVLVAKPVPLGHLPDTPPALRKEIDHLLEVAADPNAPPKEAAKACNRLVEIGRPAMPRILNLFYEIVHGPNPDSYDNRTTIFRIIKFCLVPMTRCDFGFNPGERADEGGNTAAQERETALGQYYVWWFQHNDKAYWDLLKKAREKEDESGF